jgi:hypothetical protein
MLNAWCGHGPTLVIIAISFGRDLNKVFLDESTMPLTKNIVQTYLPSHWIKLYLQSIMLELTAPTPRSHG